MKNTLTRNLMAVFLLGVATLNSVQAQTLPTTGRIGSRLGNLELLNGYPTETTARKIYDDLDFQRAC